MSSSSFSSVGDFLEDCDNLSVQDGEDETEIKLESSVQVNDASTFSQEEIPKRQTEGLKMDTEATCSSVNGVSAEDIDVLEPKIKLESVVNQGQTCSVNSGKITKSLLNPKKRGRGRPRRINPEGASASVSSEQFTSQPQTAVIPSETTLTPQPFTFNESGARGKRVAHRCPHCPRTFATAATLKTHVEDYHANDDGNASEMEIEASDEDNVSVASGSSFKNCSSSSTSDEEETMYSEREGVDDDKKEIAISSSFDKKPFSCKKPYKPILIEVIKKTPRNPPRGQEQKKYKRMEFSARFRNPIYLTPEQEGICEVCLEDCGNRLALQKHRVVVHNIHSYVHCPVCGRYLPSRHTLESHLRCQAYVKFCEKPREITAELVETVTAETAIVFPFQTSLWGRNFCTMEGCNEVFQTKAERGLHLKTHGSWTCHESSCLKTFSKAHELAIHEGKCHVFQPTARQQAYLNPSGRRTPKEEFSCSRCKYSTDNMHRYFTHFFKHLNVAVDTFEEGHKCSLCHKTFLRVDKLNEHVQMVHKDKEATGAKKLIKCQVCPETFFEPRLMHRHLRTMHNLEASFPCPDCGETFNRFGFLREHIKREHKWSAHLVQHLAQYCNYECSECKDTFTTEDRLQKHMLARHTLVDSFTCSTCQRKFKRQLDLDTHKKVQCKLVCEECGKSFRSKAKLAVHEHVHKDPKTYNFGCTEEGCEKRFFTTSKLKEHMRTHTKEKPFVCETCGKSYAHRHNFRLHLKNAHGRIVPLLNKHGGGANTTRPDTDSLPASAESSSTLN